MNREEFLKEFDEIFDRAVPTPDNVCRFCRESILPLYVMPPRANSLGTGAHEDWIICVSCIKSELVSQLSTTGLTPTGSQVELLRHSHYMLAILLGCSFAPNL
jgi:hypothetical protein